MPSWLYTKLGIAFLLGVGSFFMSRRMFLHLRRLDMDMPPSPSYYWEPKRYAVYKLFGFEGELVPKHAPLRRRLLREQLVLEDDEFLPLVEEDDSFGDTVSRLDVPH